MSYSTINSRVILIPELARSLHFTTIGLPAELKSLVGLESGEAGTSEINGVLKHHCQQIFGLPPVNVMTFDDWKACKNILLKTFQSEEFRSQMTESYGGNVPKKRESIKNWLDKSRDYLNLAGQQFSSTDSFAEAIIRNGILNPIREIESPALSRSALNYKGDPSLIQSVFWDIREEGRLELELSYWDRISDVLSGPALPSSKAAFRQIGEYDIPIAGSTPLKPSNWDTIKGHLYGAALMMISTGAVSGSGALSKGDLQLCLTCVVGGTSSAILLISTVWIGDYLQRWLSSRAITERTAPKDKNLSPVPSEISKPTDKN